jgi:cell division protein FtsI/penicillin-binding protein 2
MINNLINIPVGVGELIDKLSILKVKLQNIKNLEKLKSVETEYDLLFEKSKHFLENEEIESLFNDLFNTNSKLWKIEDEIRIEEKNKNFSEKFISLARAVYITNDERFRIKNRINEISGSHIREVKDYEDYR